MTQMWQIEILPKYNNVATQNKHESAQNRIQESKHFPGLTPSGPISARTHDLPANIKLISAPLCSDIYQIIFIFAVS